MSSLANSIVSLHVYKDTTIKGHLDFAVFTCCKAYRYTEVWDYQRSHPPCITRTLLCAYIPTTYREHQTALLLTRALVHLSSVGSQGYSPLIRSLEYEKKNLGRLAFYEENLKILVCKISHPWNFPTPNKAELYGFCYPSVIDAIIFHIPGPLVERFWQHQDSQVPWKGLRSYSCYHLFRGWNNRGEKCLFCIVKCSATPSRGFTFLLNRLTFQRKKKRKSRKNPENIAVLLCNSTTVLLCSISYYLFFCFRLQLEKPVMAQGNVEVWLGTLLQMSRKSVHHVIRTAHTAVQDQGFNLLEFLSTFPAQVLMLYSTVFSRTLLK